MARQRKPDHERLICRLPEEARLRMVDAIARRSAPVAVEYGWERKLDGATRTAGTALGVAYTPGSMTSHALVIQPHSIPRGTKRLLAIPLSQVLRVRMATLHEVRRVVNGEAHTYTPGEVIAGPPLTENEE